LTVWVLVASVRADTYRNVTVKRYYAVYRKTEVPKKRST